MSRVKAESNCEIKCHDHTSGRENEKFTSCRRKTSKDTVRATLKLGAN